MLDIKYFQNKAGNILMLGITAAVFLFAIGQAINIWKNINENAAPFRVTVQGEGRVDSTPNLATFSASVLTNSKDVKTAEEENSRIATKVVEYLKKNGVDSKDIKTSQFSVFPQYQYYESRPCILGQECSPPRPPEITSYQVSNSIEVKVRDLKKISELLKGVISSGANQVYGPNFTVDDSEDLKIQARQEAIEDAKVKARFIARDLGVRLGRVVDFNESVYGYPIYGLEAYGRGDAIDVKSLPPVEPGQDEVIVNVSVTYELK